MDRHFSFLTSMGKNKSEIFWSIEIISRTGRAGEICGLTYFKVENLNEIRGRFILQGAHVSFRGLDIFLFLSTFISFTWWSEGDPVCKKSKDVIRRSYKISLDVKDKKHLMFQRRFEDIFRTF